tara:strand:+ start:580 stop:762 length:183 start_codon:yes stop_codon:yes gene_type:complete
LEGWTIYFFLTGLKALLLHFLHLTLPWITFILGVRILALQTLQTNMFLYILACASLNFAM